MTNTVNLHSSVQGSGSHLILIHGLFGMGSNLGMIAKALSEQFCVHSLDLRNHGYSPHADNMTIQLLSDDVKSYIAQQNIQQCAIIGHSLGGKVAMQLALDHPEIVRKIIIADIAPVDYEDKHSTIINALSKLDIKHLKTRKSANEALSSDIPEDDVRQFLLMNLTKSTEGGYQWRMNLAAIKDNYRHLRENVDKPIKPNPLPALFIKGELSDYILPEHKDAIISRFPNASFKIIQGTNHWLHAEKPNIFNRLCLNFLAE